MKVSKATKWILLVGIFAILLITAAVAYGRQNEQQRALNANIAQAQQDFDKYTAKKKDLERRLNEADSRIGSVQDEFSEYTESIEINETLFEAADDAGVTITRLRSSTPADQKLSGITYRVFTLDITAEGEVLPELLNFSNKISGRFATATIESVKIDIPKVEEEGEGEEKPTTITLRLKIYAYEG